MGKAQMGKAQMGKAQMGKAQMGKAQMGKAQMGKAQMGKAQMGKAAVGSTTAASHKLLLVSRRQCRKGVLSMILAELHPHTKYCRSHFCPRQVFDSMPAAHVANQDNLSEKAVAGGKGVADLYQANAASKPWLLGCSAQPLH